MEVEKQVEANAFARDVRKAIRQTVQQEVSYWVDRFGAKPGDAADVLESIAQTLRQRK